MEGEKPTVVKEYDVFLNSSVSKNLFLLYYKNRDITRTLDKETVVSGRMKATYDLLELSIKDARRSNETISSNKVDNVTFRSQGKLHGRHILGYFVNNECHLVDFKDSFYMQTAKDTLQQSAEVPAGGDAQASTSAARIVTAGMGAGDSSSAPDPRLTFGRGFAANRKKTAENDPDLFYLRQQNRALWRSVNYHKFESISAFEMRTCLLCPPESCYENLVDRLTQADYQNAFLAPLANDAESEKSGTKQPAAELTLEGLIEKIMLKVRVIRFVKLLACLRDRHSNGSLVDSITPQNVLKGVQNFAILLHGWWVVKSELLYPKDTFSEHASVPAALMVRTRDYILAVFHRGDHLTRKAISSITKLPALEVTDILENVARMVPSDRKGHANHWEFRQPDQEFMRKHADLVQQHNQQWETRIRQLCAELKLERLGTGAHRRKRCLSGILSSGSDTEGEPARKGPRRARSPDERQFRRSISSPEPARPRKRARTQSTSVAECRPCTKQDGFLSPPRPPPLALHATNA